MDLGESGQWRSRVGVRQKMEGMQVEKSEKKGKKDQAGNREGSKLSHDIFITSMGIKMLS